MFGLDRPQQRADASDAVTDDAPGDAPDVVAPLACRIYAGSDHTCFIRTSTNMLLCVGDNTYGQLGRGTVGGEDATPLAIGAGTLVGAASRSYHSCAARTDNSVVCWGFNDVGQIGDNTSGNNRGAPAGVMNLQTTGLIATGRAFSCAQRLDGLITCWGLNDEGHLGDGTLTPRLTPTTTVLLNGTATALTLGGSQACARISDGTVRCWGSGGHGQLGDNGTSDRPTPVTPPISGVRQIVTNGYNISMASGAQTCALLETGALKCWGDNEFGQLGLGTASATLEKSPVDVPLAPTAVEIVMGRYHVCVRTAVGAVHCWGRNELGQVGDGTKAQRAAPTLVQLPRAAVHIAAGGLHTCALLDDGTTRCWGDNVEGQLGDGTFTQSDSPVVSSICQ